MVHAGRDSCKAGFLVSAPAASRLTLKTCADSTVILTGHEPHLGKTILAFLGTPNAGFLSLRKGGACQLEFKGKPRLGRAALTWLLEPEQLLRLA